MSTKYALIPVSSLDLRIFVLPSFWEHCSSQKQENMNMIRECLFSMSRTRTENQNSVLFYFLTQLYAKQKLKKNFLKSYLQWSKGHWTRVEGSSDFHEATFISKVSPDLITFSKQNIFSWLFHHKYFTIKSFTFHEANTLVQSNFELKSHLELATDSCYVFELK